jgi:hypothetical protein
MKDRDNSLPLDDEQKRQARKKENNPFSEQEKYGDEAQRREPRSGEEYQGDPSVQRHGLASKGKPLPRQKQP